MLIVGFLKKIETFLIKKIKHCSLRIKKKIGKKEVIIVPWIEIKKRDKRSANSIWWCVNKEIEKSKGGFC